MTKQTKVDIRLFNHYITNNPVELICQNTKSFARVRVGVRINESVEHRFYLTDKRLVVETSKLEAAVRDVVNRPETGTVCRYEGGYIIRRIHVR